MRCQRIQTLTTADLGNWALGHWGFILHSISKIKYFTQGQPWLRPATVNKVLPTSVFRLPTSDPSFFLNSHISILIPFLLLQI